MCEKNRANYPSMQIIRAYFMLHSYEWQRDVFRASVRIKWGMWISEGQIIRAILYVLILKTLSPIYFRNSHNSETGACSSDLNINETIQIEDTDDEQRKYIEDNNHKKKNKKYAKRKRPVKRKLEITSSSVSDQCRLKVNFIQVYTKTQQICFHLLNVHTCIIPSVSWIPRRGELRSTWTYV